MMARGWPMRRGRGRTLRAAWRAASGFEIARDDRGLLYLLDLDQFIDCHVYFGGGFDRDGVDMALSLIERYGCTDFVDIGANMGIYTVPIAAKTNVESVHAFEPDPRNFAQLNANLFLNDLAHRVTTHELALSGDAGRARLHFSRARKECDWEKANRGASSLEKREDRHTDEAMVEMRRLDDALDLRERRPLVKIDVEGHEAEVLRGMRDFLAGNLCVIMIESYIDRRDVVFKLLEEARYVEIEGLRRPDADFVFVASSLGR